MDHYLDIKLLPDPEFPAPILMSALFSKLHRGLVEHGENDIGISFPDIGGNTRTLGQRLRLHGRGAALQRLMQLGWQRGILDHTRIGDITPVPQHAEHRVVRRVQAKSSPERLRRRLIARKHIDQETAKRSIPDSAMERLELPHVVLTSATTGQRFKLFIEHLPITDHPVPGSFGSYGLSATATIPWF
jgi:CRISPR-associated endonuclease Csy4